MWVRIVLERYVLPRPNLKIWVQNAPRQDFGFANENVQLLGGNFYAIIFSRRELSSRREHYWDFVPGRILAGIPEESFFLGGISASTDFSARFLLRYAAGIFPGKDPAGKTGHLGEIPGGIPVSAGNLGGIPPGSRYPFYKGCLFGEDSLNASLSTSSLLRNIPGHIIRNIERQTIFLV